MLIGFNRVLTMSSDPIIRSFNVFESDPPEKTYKRLRIAEYNIVSAGGSHLYMALRAMAQMRVELGLFCETKLTNDMYPRTCCGYSVVATQAKSRFQGGVALFYRSDASQWTIEGTRTHGPNVISCSLVTGSRRWSILGVYIPPSEDNGETLTYLEEAVRSRCDHPIILLGDLNINLPRPDDDRSEDISTAMALLGLSDLSNSFPKPKGRWTWSQFRDGRYIHSVTDYILSDMPDAFSRWAVKCPRGYSSDHRALIAELDLARATSHRRYLRSRRRLPVRLQQPLSLEDTVFVELRNQRHSSLPKNPRDNSWISDPTWQLIDRKSTLSHFLMNHNPQLCSSLHGIAQKNLDDLILKFQVMTLNDTLRTISNTSSFKTSSDNSLTDLLSTDPSSTTNISSTKTSIADPLIDDLVLRFQDLRISPIPSISHPSSSFDNIHAKILAAGSGVTPLCFHQREQKRLGKAIRHALRQDRQRRADRVSKFIIAQVAAKNYHEAFSTLRGWYHDCGGIPPKPTTCDLHRTRAEFESLYMAAPPSGDPIPVHVPPFPVNDDVPTEEEIITALHQMRRRRVPGASGIRTEEIIRWQTNEPENWKKAVWLIKNAFATGRIPQAFGVELLALIPKTTHGNKFRGIALIEVLYKLCATIIHLRLSAAIEFHPGIHAFRRRRGTGTALLEAKLLMQQAIRDGNPLIQVFMDLSKAYDMLDRTRLMDIMAGYGVGPHLRCLLTNYWDSEVIIPKSAGYFGDVIRPTRGIRQGGPDSPVEFDIVIDCVLREWEAQLVTRNLGPLISLWYADDGRLAGYNVCDIQSGLDLFVDIFARLGLYFNADKTKFMVTFGESPSRTISDDAFARRYDPSLPTHRDRSLTQVSCPHCHNKITQQYLSTHLRRIHHIYDPFPIDPIPHHQPQTYMVSFPMGCLFLQCPVSSCPAITNSRYDLRRHFSTRHPDDLIMIFEEGLLPQCPRCHLRLRSVGNAHFASLTCRIQAKRLSERERFSKQVILANTASFSISGNPIDRVPDYLYLGRILRWNDSDDAAVAARLSKARSTWGRMFPILHSDHARPKVMARFYLAVVQAILLYGSESWVISKGTLRRLETFHARCARHIAHQHIRKLPDGTWASPPTDQVLDICGLSPISTYIAQRKTTLLQSYACDHSPLYQACVDTAPSGSYKTRQYWWLS